MAENILVSRGELEKMGRFFSNLSDMLEVIPLEMRDERSTIQANENSKTAYADAQLTKNVLAKCLFREGISISDSGKVFEEYDQSIGDDWSNDRMQIKEPTIMSKNYNVGIHGVNSRETEALDRVKNKLNESGR